MARERLLDTSTLEPPEPLQRVLEEIETLLPGEYLRMLHRREPLLLFPELERLGFTYVVRPGQQTAYEILIWHNQDAEAERAALGNVGTP